MNFEDEFETIKFKSLTKNDIKLLGPKMEIEKNIYIKEESINSSNENSEMEYIPNSNLSYLYKTMEVQNIQDSIFPKNREESNNPSSIDTSPISNQGINLIDLSEDSKKWLTMSKGGDNTTIMVFSKCNWIWKKLRK